MRSTRPKSGSLSELTSSMDTCLQPDEGRSLLCFFLTIQKQGCCSHTGCLILEYIHGVGK